MRRGTGDGGGGVHRECNPAVIEVMYSSTSTHVPRNRFVSNCVVNGITVFCTVYQLLEMKDWACGRGGEGHGGERRYSDGARGAS